MAKARSANFGVDFRLKDWFFDRPNLEFAIERAEIKSMSKVGAFVRRRARTSLRRSKKSSPAGQPPRVHTADKIATLKNILFGYDPRIRGVVVGPVRLNHVAKLNRVILAGTLPQLMEFGGQAGIREWYDPRGRRWIPGAWRSKRLGAQFRQRIRRARYAERPFMAPALEAEVRAGTIPSAWRGQVSS